MDKLKNVEFKEDGIAIRKWFRWETVPYSEIVQAYRQIAEAKGSICCGKAVFEMHRVILVKKSGEKETIEMPDRASAVALLDQVSEACPGIIIGYKKEEESGSK